ncbi:MAG: PLP-dependent cysteine synthase family protein [Saprospiraceae bacterium]
MTVITNETDRKLESRIEHVSTLIGNTPLYEFKHVFAKAGVKVMAKLEWMQLGGSVKSRPAFNIIKQAILRGDYGQGQILLDATSGNTGIAYSAVAAALGLPVKICLPETASKERISMMRTLGADLVLTPGDLGVDGSQQQVRAFYESEPNKYFLADQYANPDNWGAHYATTGPEIVAQTEGAVTHFVSALGTSGTQMGVGRYLREHVKGVSIVALQPSTSDHSFEGWKHMATAGRIPPIYDPLVPHRMAAVSNAEADAMVKRVAREEGLLLSPSAAGNLAGAIKVAEQLESGVVVTTFADDFTKYSADYARIFAEAS